MLCPFCQFELDEKAMRCDNCAAEFPTPGLALTWAKARMLLVCGGILTVCAGILNNCVLNYLPGAVDSPFNAPGSAQLPLTRPDTKDAAVQALLQQWQQGGAQVDLQNPAGPDHIKSH